MPDTIELVGSVEPYTRSIIASEVAGLVEAIPVEEGDRVKEGQVLCRLRDTTRRLAYEQAVQALRQSEQELAELEAGTRPEEIDQAKAEMEEARAVYEKWQHELTRVTRLREQRSASDKEYNDTVADAAASRERLARAKATYDLAVAGPRKEVIARARFAVEARRVAADRLKYDLDQTVIRAPFTGYVTVNHTEIGEWIAAGGSVVELIDLEHVLLRVDVPESAIAGSRVGAAATVQVDALSLTLQGAIKHVIPQADPKARTFPVEIELANTSGRLKSGMFVRAQVPAGPTINSIIVPRDALLQRGRTHYVVKVGPAPPPAQGEMATPLPVRIGAEVGDWMAISSPMIAVGDMVAVKGHDRVFGPMPVMSRPREIAPPQIGPTASNPPTSRPAAAPPASRTASRSGSIVTKSK